MELARRSNGEQQREGLFPFLQRRGVNSRSNNVTVAELGGEALSLLSDPANGDCSGDTEFSEMKLTIG